MSKEEKITIIIGFLALTVAAIALLRDFYDIKTQTPESNNSDRTHINSSPQSQPAKTVEKKGKLDIVDYDELGSIEMIDLLKIFSDSNLYWTTGSDLNSPIQWLHEGLLSIDKDEHYLGYGKLFYGNKYALGRIGEVYITLNGVPTHTILRNKKMPANWRIIMSGANSGVFEINVETSIYSNEFWGFEGYFIKNKILKNKTILKEESGYDRIEYLLQIGGEEIAVIEDKGWGGTAGCLTTFEIKLE